MKVEIKRCNWLNLKNEKYVEYHDKEWGVPKYKDKELFELFVLEPFQAGLSWETILNKRDSFRKAFDNYNIEKICNYDDKKIEELMQNKNIVRNKRKIIATINNADIFRKIQKEYYSFSNYIWSFTNGRVVYESGKTSSELSDKISNDLKKRGMKFIGTTIVYSYLQAIGIIYSHDKECFLYKER